MQEPVNPSENKTTYFINPNASGETKRLIEQDHTVTAEMGALFPDNYTPAPRSMVVDFACGPGGWASQVAFEHPDCKVIGVDISSTMIRYAKAQAQARRLYNLTFQEGSILDPLPWSDGACDVVNTRLASSFMPKDKWQPFVLECKRITRPGGIVRVTEAEWIFTNSPAGEQLAKIISRAQWLTGKSFSPDGNRFGCTMALPKLFREAQFPKENIHKQAYSLEFSYQTPNHWIWYQNVLAGIEMMRPFLLKAGVVTELEFRELLRQFDLDMQAPEFIGEFFLLSVWGINPQEEHS